MDAKQLNENLYTSLKELGLTEAEINLYTISLQLGPSPIKKIAEHLGVPRPNIYTFIQGLEKHGLAKFSDRGKYLRRFVVEPPTIILQKMREKREKLSRLDNDFVAGLPEMLARYHQGENSTQVKILQGREQYIAFFDQSLREESKEIQYFGSAKDFVDFITPAYDAVWTNRRVKKGVFLKALISPSEEIEKEYIPRDTAELREIRILKNTEQSPASFQIFANKVAIFQPKAPLVVLIEDQFIVAMMKNIFSELWQREERSKKYIG
jgi:sugar-specific transcriptional regulator TrmB